MSEQTLIENGAPTLAGLKTGNMFTCPYTDRKSINEDISRMNRLLVPKGIRMIPLRYGQKRVLLYLYRPGALARDLSSEEAEKILKSVGYEADSEESCLRQLIHRICSEKEFPHEVGLFLSYPPEDVNGFMHRDSARCKCTGFWKVYGDEDSAQKTFAKYRTCNAIYSKCWQKGVPLSRLAIKTTNV